METQIDKKTFHQIVEDIRDKKYEGKKAEGYDFYYLEKEIKSHINKVISKLEKKYSDIVPFLESGDKKKFKMYDEVGLLLRNKIQFLKSFFEV